MPLPTSEIITPRVSVSQNVSESTPVKDNAVQCLELVRDILERNQEFLERNSFNNSPKSHNENSSQERQKLLIFLEDCSQSKVVFAGKYDESINVFLRHVEQKATCYELSEPQLLNALPNLFKGSALSYYQERIQKYDLSLAQVLRVLRDV